MNNKQFDNLETGTKVLMKAWDHENNKIVETVATYLGWCDHPEYGTAVTVSYENKDCHLNHSDWAEETETDIAINSFTKNVIKVMEVA